MGWAAHPTWPQLARERSLMHLFDYRCFLRPPRWPPRPGPAQAGWRASWLAQIRPDPAIPACRRCRKWPPWHCRGRGASGGSLYDGYRLVPGSSRPAGVVTRSCGLARGARELDSTSIVRPSACRGHAAGRPAEGMSPMEGGGRGVKPRPPRLTSDITLLGPTRLSEQTRPPRTE